MKLTIQPINLKPANAFVIKHHRHHKKVRGEKYSICIVNEVEELQGVAICGRPTGRYLDTGLTLEVYRLCVKEGVKNGCSMLYGACARIARDMGYRKIVTFTLMSEPGVSLLASGWTLEAVDVGGKEWNSSNKIKRTSETTDLFGTIKKYPSELKKRWVKFF